MTLFVNLLRYFTISTLVSFSLQDSVPGCDCPGTPCSDVFIYGEDGEVYPSCLPFYNMAESSRHSQPFTLDDKPVCDSLLTPNNKEKDYPYLSMIGGNGTSCDDAIKHIESTCYEPAPIFLYTGRLDYGPSCTSFSSPYTPGLNIAKKCSKDKGLEIYIVQDADKDIDFFDKVCSEKVEIAPALTSSDWIEPEEGQRYMCKDFTHPTSGDQNFVLVRSLGKDVCPIVNEDEDEEENSGSSVLSKDNLMIIAFVSILVHLTNAIL